MKKYKRLDSNEREEISRMLAQKCSLNDIAKKLKRHVSTISREVRSGSCNEGIRMLWSEAVEENDPSKVEFRGARGQGFRFVRFRRIKRVALEFED